MVLRSRQKMVGPERQGMVGKRLKVNSRLRLLAVLGCVLGVISCTGCATSDPQAGGALTRVTAAARAKDYRATSEYLRARAEEIRTTMNAMPLNAASAEAVIAHAGSECPGALRGTPAVAAAEGHLAGAKGQMPVVTAVLMLEIDGSVVGRYIMAGGQPVTESAAQMFAAKVTSLHWADPRITNLAHALVGVEAQLLAVPPLDVCRVIREWAGSGYMTAPGVEESLRPHGVIGQAWRRALRAIGCRRSAIPTEKTFLAVMRPYERPGGRLTTRQIEEMEARLVGAVVRSENGRVEELMRVLGVPSSRKVKKKWLNSPEPDCAGLK